MLDALRLSFTLQAFAIVGLGIAIVLLVRNLRFLHAKLPAAGALMLSGGLRVGDAVPEIIVESLDGTPIRIAGRAAPLGKTGALIFFFSPSCPVCQAMVPVMKSFAREHADQFKTIFATDGQEQGHGDFAKRYGLERHAYAVSEPLGMAIGVGRVPQAVLIGQDGKIAARGLINTREHLESLLNARDTQRATLQSYLAEQSA